MDTETPSTTVVSLRFTQQQIGWLEQAAESEDVTVSALIRRAVGEYLLGDWESIRPRKYRRRETGSELADDA